MEQSRPTPPIACTLDAAGMDAQLDKWASLRRSYVRHETTASGITLWFDPSVEAALRAVAAKEAACCSFLRLEMHTELHAAGDSLRLEITSDQTQALPVIELLAKQAGAG